MADTFETSIARLQLCCHRFGGVTSRALSLHEFWTVLNEAPERRLISLSAASEAAELIQVAVMRELIMILVRLFDTPRRDRISFPSVRQLLAIPGVMDVYHRRARSRLGYEPDDVRQELAGALTAFNARLDALFSEDPNRLIRLRAFRDANIAHELHSDPTRPPAFYNYVTTLLADVVHLTECVGLIVLGTSYHWSEGSMRESANALWGAVAQVERMERGSVPIEGDAAPE